MLKIFSQGKKGMNEFISVMFIAGMLMGLIYLNVISPTTESGIVTPIPESTITLLKPVSLDEPIYDPTEFEWKWDTPLARNQGFEIRVWREGEAEARIHNAVVDNNNGKVIAVNNGKYMFKTNICNTPNVGGRTDKYFWTVLLVEISPKYKELDIKANPSSFYFESDETCD